MSLARTLLTAGSLARSQYFEREDLERLQAARLRRLLAHAAATVPYYRDLFARSGVVPGDIRHPSDLARVPISTRHGLQAAGLEAYTSRAFAPSQLEEACTTGSSGRRFTVRYDPGFNAVRRATFLRALQTSGYRFGRPLMLLTHERRKAPPRWLRWSYVATERPPEENYEAYVTLRPAVLYGFLTPLRQLAEVVRRRGRRGHRPGAVVTTAETLDATTRALLGDSFGAPIFDFYGLTETGLLGWQCAPGGAYHLAEDTTIVELLPVPGHASRRVVVTVLDLFGTPMIRYDTGDLALPEPADRCRCGRTLTRVRQIDGRLIDCVRLPSGRQLSPYFLVDALEKLEGVERFQVVQEGADAITVRLQGPQAGTPVAAGRVHELLGPILERGMAIHVAAVPTLDPPPGRKFRAVECRVGTEAPS